MSAFRPFFMADAPATKLEVDEAGLTQVNPDLVTRGREAWSRLKKSLADWFAVAEALHHGQHQAMVESHSNEPKGARFQAKMGEWWRTTGFDEIDKGIRSRLLLCLKYRDEIEAWHKALPSNKRLQLNHPSSVWRNWQSATIASRATPSKKPPKLSPIGRLKQEVVRLEEENLQLRRAGDDLFSPKDSAADIARLIADRLLQCFSPTKVRHILESLPKIIAERAELPREPMTATTPALRKKKHRAIEEFQRDVPKRRTAVEAAS
jgi:hypothetical protein